MFALISSIAHAGIFDWVTGMFATEQEEKPLAEAEIEVECIFDEATQTQKCYTKAAETPSTIVLLKEQVTCKFLGSTSTQKCYAPNIDKSCTGIDSCTMTITGTEGRRIDINACGEIAYATFDSSDEIVEFKCEARETEKVSGKVKCVFDEATQTQKCYPTETLTAPVENVKEQITCVFLESKKLQKCYSEFGQTCEGETSCVMDIIGETGRKIALKSSCGGYAYITIDGTNENSEFKCITREEVTPTQIVGRGFQRAAWACYDNARAVSQDVGCLPSEVWNKKAEMYCKGHCYPDNSKCGVNSFSVLEECYETVIGVAQPTVSGAIQPAGTGIQQPTGTVMTYPTTTAAVQPAGVGIQQPTVTAAMQPAVTAAAQPVDLEKLKKEMKESKETLFCKDSCPLDGKCYPFGYRKDGEYCPDNGMFKEQLESEEACDNNFECSTNVCVDGKCVSSGILQKIISWFTKLF